MWLIKFFGLDTRNEKILKVSRPFWPVLYTEFRNDVSNNVVNELKDLNKTTHASNLGAKSMLSKHPVQRIALV